MFWKILALAVVTLFAWLFLYLKQQGADNVPISPQQGSDLQIATVVAQNLDTPWGIAFLPVSPASPNRSEPTGEPRGMLVTERQGTLRFINKDGKLEPTPVAIIKGAKEISEGGLLGIAIHPNFSSNSYVYFYYTYAESGDKTLNRVVRAKYVEGKLGEEEIVVDNIPGAPNHNGGRIKFGPNGLLYITTGDAQNPSLAQVADSLAGKILRVNDSGAVSVYSYGHRNPQGLAWDSSGQLWSTEHGQSATDEINLVEMGANYGWPTIRGDQTKEGMQLPKRHSAADTWAPAGAAFVGNSLFFGGLRGQALYEAVIEGSDILELKTHFKGEFGRIRDVVLGPDGMLYITTSNRDGRGNPTTEDDRIIKVNPQSLQ